MVDSPTHNDLFLAGRRQALLGATRFNPEIIDTEGSDVNVVFNVAAAMGSEVVRYVVNRLNARSLGTAADEDLDRLVYDEYQLPRLGARSAVVTLYLSRSGTTGFTVEKGSAFSAETGETFLTQNDVAFGENVLGPLAVLATAQQTGRAGNVAASTITRVTTAQADSTLVVINTEQAAGGRDEETDEAYQDRARQYFTAARRGTKEAIEFGSLSVGRVSQANSIELIDEGTGLPGYRTQVNIADVDGQSNAALAAEVEDSLDEYRCWGVPVQVISAIAEYITVVATGLQFQAGYNTSDVLDDASKRVLAAVNTTRPGATLRKSSIVSALERTPGLIVPDGSVTSPAGDVIPTTGTAIRIKRDGISLSG